jgi:hypothetical protein
MTYQDFRLSKELVLMHGERLQRRAETRSLLRQAGLMQPSWLDHQRSWLLCQLGRGLVAMGKRLEQHGLPESVPVKG